MDKEESTEALLARAIEILTKTAITESADHFLTFRLWSKAIIGLPVQEMKRSFPDYLRYTQWMIKERFRHPTMSSHLWHAGMVGFFLDYAWMALALFDHTHPLTVFISTGRTTTEATLDLATQWDKMLWEPAILAVWALPSPRAVIEEGIPFLVDYWQRKVKEEEREREREREKEREENDEREKKREHEREKEREEENRTERDRESGPHNDGTLFQELNFKGFDLLYDHRWTEVVDFVTQEQPEGVQRLSMSGCSRISASNLSRLLGPALATLELAETPYGNSVFDTICCSCPNITRLVLDCAYQNVPPDWIDRLMENLKSLRELETDLEIFPSDHHNKDTLLAHLEVLRCGDPVGLLGQGYRLPNVRSLDVAMQQLVATCSNLGGCGALRRLKLRNTFSSDDEFGGIDLLCRELAQGCPSLEELDLAPYCFTPHHIETLAATGNITSLHSLSILMIVNRNDNDTGPEYEATFMRTLAHKFPSLKHLSVDQRLDERQGEVLLSLCGGEHIPAGTPLLQLESLTLHGAETSAREWLRVLRYFKDSIKRLPALPADFADEHVGELCEVLVGVEEVSFVLTGFSLEGLKKLLPCMKSLKKVMLPCRLIKSADLEHLEELVPVLRPSVLHVVTHEPFPAEPNYYNNNNSSIERTHVKWPRLLDFRKGSAPLILQVNTHSNDYARVKLTGALGPEDDTINKTDTLSVLASTDDSISTQLKYLQAIHIENSRY